MRAAAGIRVLADYRSSGIDAHRDRRDNPWIVDGKWCWSIVSPDGQWLALPLLDDPTMNLWALSTATGEMRQITDFGERAISIARHVSWAPDGHSIFAAIAEHDADIILLEGLPTR